MARTTTIFNWINVVCLIVSCFLCMIDCFNLETRLPIVKEYIGTRNDSYFGFSVAQHQRTQQDGSVENLLLVGAPKLQTNQPGILQGGGVFKCPLNSYTDDCELLEIDTEGNDIGEEKSDQWLGVTVRSQGKDGKVVACAHRYKQVGDDYIYGVGKCYQLNSALELDIDHINGGTWTVCEGRTPGHENYGFCQAGTDCDFTTNRKDIIIGTPGSMDWRGVIFTNDASDDEFPDPVVYKSGRTEEEARVQKHSYLGFSVDSGNFITSGETWYVAGAPRHNSSGAVVLFAKGDDVLVAKDAIYAERLASSFGYDVKALDINNDGFDDLVVGAPLYYDKEEGIGGLVYVYMNDQTGNFDEGNPTRLSGPLDSMFGMSLTSLGDINLDGFNDIAVGAPYEDNGKGAVYIFHGGPDGIHHSYSQKIMAADLPDSISSLRTFGYSLSGGLDLDDNGYPDLVIGSYESGAVVMLRSRTVLNLGSTLEANPTMLDVKNKTCQYEKKEYLCFTVKVCLNYTSDSGFNDAIDVEYYIEAEQARRDIGLQSRVFFKDSSSHEYQDSMRLRRRGQQKCDQLTLYVTNDIRDILRPIDLELSYNIVEEDPALPPPGPGLPSLSGQPVMNMNMPITNSIKVDFVKECGRDNICDSELGVSASFDLPGDPPTWSLGEGDKGLFVKVTITNSGEAAYEAKMTVIIPDSLDYVNVVPINVPDDLSEFGCDDDPENATVIICELGNPYPENREIMFNLKFGHERLLGSVGSISMNMFVETTSRDDNPYNDEAYISANIEVVTDLLLQGQSNPELVSYSGEVRGESAMEYEYQIGNPVNHIYVLKNKGPGTVEVAHITISWPYEVASGKWLLYMTDYPELDGEGNCTIDPMYVNFLDVKKNKDESIVYSPDELPASTRRKRDVAPSHDIIGPTGEKTGRIETLSCQHGTARCFTFDCFTGPLASGDSTVVRIRSRLWNSTFLEDFRKVTSVNIVSTGEVKILNGQYIGELDPSDNSLEIITEAHPDLAIIEEKKAVPIWIIILAALGGLLLLIIVVIILWRCGFFKRKRVNQNTTSFRSTPSRHSRNGSTTEKSYKYEATYQDDRYN